MSAPFWITGGRLADGSRSDLLIENGRIARLDAADAGADATGSIDARGMMVLTALVEGHVHLDKTFLGCVWQPHLPGRSVAERIRLEKVARARVEEPVEVRGGRLVERLLACGAVTLRSHVDIDPDWGLANLDAVLAIRERFAGRALIQIVAFPQSGILASPGTAELLDEALAQGAELVGGLDPAGIDGDPVAHLDQVFGLAQRHGKGVDVHLHDAAELGCFELRLIAERTRALGMAGRVTASHAYCLGAVGEAELARTAEALATSGVAVMTSVPPGPMPPIERLEALGVTVFAASDNIRDAWSPLGSGDTLERASLAAYRNGWGTDGELARAMALVTTRAAAALGIPRPAVAAGAVADLLLVEAETLGEVVAARPARRIVLKRGRIVAGDVPSGQPHE